jgi:hypothetical protein
MGVNPNNSKLLSIDDSLEEQTPEVVTQETEEGFIPLGVIAQQSLPPPNILNTTNDERDVGSTEEIKKSGGGRKVGLEVGGAEGNRDGQIDGEGMVGIESVGALEGAILGQMVGATVGRRVGRTDGGEDGDKDGRAEG